MYSFIFYNVFRRILYIFDLPREHVTGLFFLSFPDLHSCEKIGLEVCLVQEFADTGSATRLSLCAALLQHIARHKGL